MPPWCAVCLVVSRRESLWMDERGAVVRRTRAMLGRVNAPYMTVGGRRFVFAFAEAGVALRVIR
jgi:hypothetical protein